MTRIQIYECDICGEQMRDEYYGGLQYWKVNANDRQGVTQLELCSKCFDEIVSSMRRK